MKKLIVLIALIPGLVFAETANVSWTNATLNEDGTPIPETGDNALATTTVKYSECVAGDLGGTILDATVNFPLEAVEIFGLTQGEWCFRAYHTNNAGVSSADSNLSVKTILPPPATPQPPVITAVQITVFTIIKQIDRFVFLPVGTVPEGTECVRTMSINEYNVVPREAVTWSGSVRPAVVVARCG